MDNVSAYPELSRPTSTRLLKLAPKSKNLNGDLTGELIEIDLDKPPKFDAISYVWGKRIGAGKVYCKTTYGKEMKEIRFTKNGEDALRRMQHRTKARFLWIDAICINQESVEERNHQFAIMASIYSAASCVLVWLPDDEWRSPETSLDALKACLLLIKFTPLKRHGGWKILGRIIPRSKASTAVESISRAPWFSRVWTILEFAFARRCLIYFGNPKPICGITLYQASSHNWFGDSPFNWDTARTQARDMVKNTRPRPFDAPTFLRACRSLESTLGADRVFSLYPILASSDDSALFAQIPNYSKPQEEVFQAAAVALINKHSDITSILDVPGVRDSSSCLSWVADLTIPPRREMDRFVPEEDDLTSSLTTYCFSADYSVLQIRGVTIDRVSIVAHEEILPDTTYNFFKLSLEQQERILQVLLRWYGLAMTSKRPPTVVAKEFILVSCEGWRFRACIIAQALLSLVQATDPSAEETPFQKWKRTHDVKPLSNLQKEPVAHRVFEEICLYLGPLLPVSVEELAKRIIRLLEQEGVEFPFSIQKPLTGFFRRADKGFRTSLIARSFEGLTDREFFMTENGKVGLTNGHVEKGDTIVLVPVLNGPAVLRKRPSGKAYKFVGGADIAGMMSRGIYEWEEEPTIFNAEFFESKKLEVFDLT